MRHELVCSCIESGVTTRSCRVACVVAASATSSFVQSAIRKGGDCTKKPPLGRLGHGNLRLSRLEIDSKKAPSKGAFFKQSLRLSRHHGAASSVSPASAFAVVGSTDSAFG